MCITTKLTLLKIKATTLKGCKNQKQNKPTGFQEQSPFEKQIFARIRSTEIVQDIVLRQEPRKIKFNI